MIVLSRKAAKRTAPKSAESFVPRTAAEKAEAFKLLDVLLQEFAREDALREVVATAVAVASKPGKVRAKKKRATRH